MTHKEFEVVETHGGRRGEHDRRARPGFSQGRASGSASHRRRSESKTAYEDANRQLQAKIREVEQDRPSMKAQMEIVQLRKENQTLKTENSSLRGKVADLEATVRRLVQIIREKLPEVYAAITQPKRDRQQPSQKQKPKSRDLER